MEASEGEGVGLLSSSESNSATVFGDRVDKGENVSGS